MMVFRLIYLAGEIFPALRIDIKYSLSEILSGKTNVSRYQIATISMKDIIYLMIKQA